MKSGNQQQISKQSLGWSTLIPAYVMQYLSTIHSSKSSQLMIRYGHT